MRPKLALALTLAVAGCGVPFVVPVPMGAAPQGCEAPIRQNLVGQPATVAAGLLGVVRMIRPNQPVTRDFRQDRLNVEVDAQERITRVYCG